MAHTAQEYIGSYRLLNLIRTGKTCQVWEVMNDLKSERLALKLMVSDYIRDKEEVGYLRHEFEVGSKLVHPQVIKIYDFAADKDKVFLAMELCQTPNLKQLIQQGVEPLFPVMHKIIEQAATGLAYFHTQGWVHRDIKPDNFLVKPNGDVKLIDFALAQRKPGAMAAITRFLPSLNAKIQGTRSYMSPEQIRNKTLDERADIYSFGCMMHELLGGKPPFTGNSTNDLLMKHLKSGAPPLQAANRNVTDDFANLVKRMLAKAPAARPATMFEVLREFNALRIFKEPPRREKV